MTMTVTVVAAHARTGGTGLRRALIYKHELAFLTVSPSLTGQARLGEGAGVSDDYLVNS